jgi:hypothetical protein
MLRTNYTVGMVLSNFRAYDFHNDPTGSPTTPQHGLFSDQYGDQNFVIEHFEIDNTDSVGIYLKGSVSIDSGEVLNYGTIRYGIVKNVRECIQFNALDTTQLTTVEYVVCNRASGSGIFLSSETIAARNLLIHHVTMAGLQASNPNFHGCFYSHNYGIGLNVTIRDVLCHISGGSFGYVADFNGGLPDMIDYNHYYRDNLTETWASNGSTYPSIADWRTYTGRESNSAVLLSNPFVDGVGGDFRLQENHPARTASSTGGEVGAYATMETIGVHVDQH